MDDLCSVSLELGERLRKTMATEDDGTEAVEAVDEDEDGENNDGVLAIERRREATHRWSWR